MATNQSYNSMSNSQSSRQFPPKFHKRLLLRHDILKVERSGNNEDGVFGEIMKKELIKPFDKSKYSIYNDLRRANSNAELNKTNNISNTNNISHSNNINHGNNNNFADKWALGTVKVCTSPERVPQVQQFKNYNFPNISKEEKKKYENSFLDTDNLTIKVPKEKYMDVNRGPNQFLQMKRKTLFILYYVNMFILCEFNITKHLHLQL